ncbi:MAG: hypothetical protein OQK49_06350 [Proteobacteria bacterium]|nr:hypothetical protein [Pseudomonadota bacterium]
MNKVLKVSFAVVSMAFTSMSFAQCDDTNLAAWDNVREDAAGQMDVVAGGLDGTTCRLEVSATTDNAQRARLQDRSPSCESSFRGRFLINADNFGALANNQRNKVHNIQCNVNDNGGAVACANVGVLQLRLQGDNGTNIFRSFVTDEGPATAADNRRKFDVPVNSGEQAFEYQWIRASAPGASDGIFRMWANSNTTEASPDVEFTDLQNYNYCIDRMNLGIIAPTIGWANNQTNVKLQLDEYESRRQTPINLN